MPSQVVENLIDFAAFLGTADRARWELINGAVATLEATGLSPVPENLADAVNTVREMVELLGPGNAGFVGFTSEAAMDADLNHDANTVAWVPEVGYFVKTGASGAGTWDLFADEPVSPTIEIPVGQIARVPSGEADIAVFDFASRATLVRDAEDTSNNAVGDETAAGTFSRASTGYRRLRNGLYASVASDVMRITHANDLTPGGLLIEAAATNKFTANNALAAGLTGQGGATATAAAAIAGPDGATGLVALIENATTWPVSYVQRAEASAAGSNTEEWVASCWIRAVTGTIDGLIRCDTTAGNSNRNFTGITTAWQRVDSGDVFNFTSASSTNRVFRLSSLTGPAYIVWAQMEAGRTPYFVYSDFGSKCYQSSGHSYSKCRRSSL
jgi:hypothetical protein